jgi:Holliday junction resolvase RusA-like endonuclease
MMERGTEIYHFTLDRKPFSWQRVIPNGGKPYLPRDTVMAKEHVVRAFQNAYPGATAEPLTGRLGIRMVFYMRQRYQQDIDNLAKLVLDAGNGLIWKDDQQFDAMDLRIMVRKDEEPRTEVFVFELGSVVITKKEMGEYRAREMAIQN